MADTLELGERAPLFPSTKVGNDKIERTTAKVQWIESAVTAFSAFGCKKKFTCYVTALHLHYVFSYISWISIAYALVVLFCLIAKSFRQLCQ